MKLCLKGCNIKAKRFIKCSTPHKNYYSNPEKKTLLLLNFM